jgi:hypothetical protein
MVQLPYPVLRLTKGTNRHKETDMALNPNLTRRADQQSERSFLQLQKGYQYIEPSKEEREAVARVQEYVNKLFGVSQQEPKKQETK